MPRILIVDDEPLIALMVSEWIEELGHGVAGPCRSVASALASIETDPPDAAILDVSLGNESGYKVAERLAEKSVPFAFATGYAKASLSPAFSHAPVLIKPYDFADLKAVVAEMLKATD
jgi:CheY-like chemotaxis protein